MRGQLLRCWQGSGLIRRKVQCAPSAHVLPLCIGFIPTCTNIFAIVCVHTTTDSPTYIDSPTYFYTSLQQPDDQCAFWCVNYASHFLLFLNCITLKCNQRDYIRCCSTTTSALHISVPILNSIVAAAKFAWNWCAFAMRGS